MAVDFATFSQIVHHVTNVRKPVLLRGRHGIGKSTVVYQYADKKGMPVVSSVYPEARAALQALPRGAAGQQGSGPPTRFFQ